MIYYFSGTGNSKWVAEQLAVKTNNIALNLSKLGGAQSVDNQIVGIVFPIYAWGVPEPVLEFARRLQGQPAFTFGVCTCGAEAGNAMSKLDKVFSLDSAYSVAMPVNYIMGGDMESEQVVAGKIAGAREKLDGMAAQIRALQPARDVQPGKFPWIKSTLVNFGFNQFSRSTKPFHVTEDCISCGECAEACPAGTITLIDGKPRWGEKCYQCTACINGCPVRAIEYGTATAARGRYQFRDSGS